MEQTAFRMPLYLPAQGAVETEATIIQWHVAAGDSFHKGQVLAQIDSVKSVFDFEAPCDGKVVRVLHAAGSSIPYSEPVLEIETADEAMRDWIPPAVAAEQVIAPAVVTGVAPAAAVGAAITGFGGFIPDRVVTNDELVAPFTDISSEYVFQVTGIRERRWADPHDKPSDLAFAAALDCLRRAKMPIGDIDALIVSTTTPDMAMPSTACILQERLNLGTVPSFDLNAACSGWLYAVSMAQGMIYAGQAQNVLVVGADMQSRLLDRADRATCFLFGDGGGAAIISRRTTGHRIRQVVLGSDVRGLKMARREMPGYAVMNGYCDFDPWIRIDGQALFRVASEAFASVTRDVIAKAGWTPEEVRCVVPHQANARIIKAAAKRCGVPFEKFFLNVERMGNTSSASIPLAMLEVQEQFQPDDKIVLCSVGAGCTMAALAVEW